MRSTLCSLAAVTFAAIAGCNSSTGMADCGAKTTASFRDDLAGTARITSIATSGQSKLIEVVMDVTPPLRQTFIVADTTAVFERFGEGTPRPSSSCRLAVGEVVEIRISEGFGDFIGDVPTPTLRQLVIER